MPQTNYTYERRQKFSSRPILTTWTVVAVDKDNGVEIEIAKVSNLVQHPASVALAIADSLNRNKKFKLVDLV